MSPPQFGGCNSRFKTPPRLKQPRFFTTEVHGNPHSRGTETVGETDRLAQFNPAECPLHPANGLSTISTRALKRRPMDKSPCVEIVQTVRAGQFESRVSGVPCLQGLHDTRLPNTPRGRFELFAEDNGSPMTTAMPGSWRKVLKSPAYWMGMFAVGEALRSHFPNRFCAPRMRASVCSVVRNLL